MSEPQILTEIVLKEKYYQEKGNWKESIAYHLLVNKEEICIFNNVSQTNNPYSHRIYKDLEKFILVTRPDGKLSFKIDRDKSNEALNFKKTWGQGISTFEETCIDNLIYIYNDLTTFHPTPNILENCRKYFTLKHN